jgi:GNAT superfamily N-acetyltransferase
MESTEGNKVAHIFKRALRVLRTEGPRGIVQRFKDRARMHFSQIHLLVLASSSDSLSDVLARQDKRAQALKRALATPLEFKQVLLTDDQVIDELTELDPWKVPKPFTLDKLREGWLCFAAKKDDRILASAWVGVNCDFKEDFLDRYFTLGPEEAFYWRGFCVPDSRGRGIMPRLIFHIFEHLKREHGKTHHLTVVRGTNLTVQHTLTKIGWQVVGRAGFIEMFSVRFHYLWGREAFKETRRRIFLQRTKQLSH